MPQLETEIRPVARTPDGDRECYQFAFDAECLERLRVARTPVVEHTPRPLRPGLPSVPLFVADVASEAW